MSDLPPKPEATAHFDEHVLLEQGAWVRRLARGLVSDEAAAEDLSQDVMVAALSKSPGLHGAQLRGWLATVARRLAGRGHERNAARRHTEHSVARQETEDRGVSRRLELHRQLTGAVERLDEPYRTALVLRYFESLAPREIAERLGITPAAARKRVSRGLASLREDLDGEFGDRQTWLAAFAPLAFPLKKAAPLAGGTSLFALAKTKLALVAGVACFAGLVYLYTPFFESSPPVDGLEVWGGVPVSLLARGDSPPAPDPGTPTSKALTADPLRTPVAAAPALGPRVRIVDADGAFPAGTHAAWIDPFSQVHPLELDAQGTAPRPVGSTSARFFAHNPDAGSAVVVGGPEGEDALLVLSPGHALRGRVIEDGGPPSQPVFLEAFPTTHSLGLRTEEADQCTLLEKALAIQGASSTWTQSDGSFVFESFPAETTGFLLLPASHSYVGEYETDPVGRVSFSVGEGELLVETTRYPTIQGRLVWADDRSPVTTLSHNPGIVWSRISASRSPKGPVRYGRIDQNGHFTIGVEDLASTTDQHSNSELSLIFGLTSETKGPARESLALFTQRLSIDGQRLPLDLGTIEIARPLTASFRVLDSAGEPVEGATLATALGSAKSNAQGLATLPCKPGDTVRAIRQGYSVGELILGNQLPLPGGSLPLQLEPGVDFSIDLGPNPNALFRIELAWDVSPFQGIALDGPGPFAPFPAHLMFALHGVPAPGGKWKTRTPGAPGTIRLFLPPSGRVELPGLRPRSSFEVRLLDSLSQPLVEHKVTLPAAGGSLELELLPSGGSSLQIRLVDTDGRRIEDGRFVIIATGNQPLEPDQRPTYVWKKGFDCPGGSYTIDPLAPGTFTISATTEGDLEATITDYVVNTPHQVLELTLEPR